MKRNLEQEKLILGLFESRAVDPALPKGLRDFNAEQAEKFRKSIALRDAAEKRREPRAFGKFMKTLENENVSTSEEV